MGDRIDLPGLQEWEHGGDSLKIFHVIGPETKTRALPCPPGNGFKKTGLQQAVLVVAFFRPRIWKQNPDLGKGDGVGQGIDQFAGFGLDKVAVGELGAFGFAPGTPNPVADQVHADAEGLGMFRGVAREKVPVTRADFQDDDGRGGDDRGQLGAQRGPALGDMLDEFRFESHASF